MYPSIFNEVGGIFVHQQVKELQKQGCEVKVISPVPWTPFPIKYFSKKWKKYSKIPQKAIWEGIEVYYPRYFTLSGDSFHIMKGLLMPCTMRNFVKRNLTNDFDIIHAHITSFHMGWLGKSLKERFNKKLVITVHGSKSTYPSERIRKIFIKKVFNTADKIIAVSNCLKDRVLKYGIDKGKVIVIGNGVDLKIFHPINRNEVRAILGLPMGDKIILNVASLSKIKGQTNLISAFSKVKKSFSKTVLVIVGGGELKQELKRKAREEGVEDSIRFVGPQPHGKIPLWLNAADLFVLSSFNEGMPVSLIEAIACGKPVIATKVGGIPEVICSENYGILVEPGNPTQLYNAIIKAFKKDWRENEIAKYGAKFTWENVAKSLQNLYMNLL